MPKKKNNPAVKPDLAATVEDTFKNNPNLRKVLGKLFLRQSLETGLFLSCLIVGMMLVLNSVKLAYGLGWVGDAVFGAILIVVGLVYVVRSLK